MLGCLIGGRRGFMVRVLGGLHDGGWLELKRSLPPTTPLLPEWLGRDGPLALRSTRQARQMGRGQLTKGMGTITASATSLTENCHRDIWANTFFHFNDSRSFVNNAQFHS